MRKYVLSWMCLLLAFTIGAVNKRDFTAVCLNVDGLPPSISILGIKINLNPDAKEGAGAAAIGKKIAENRWDFVALSEDFNYHNDLMGEVSGLYNAGTWRGNVALNNGTLSGGKLKVNSDGLGFLWRKNISASGERMTAWSKTNGYTNNGSDELIKKGYRYYTVTLGNGLEVDVYSIHMDAETTDADNEARQSQISQLIADIKGTDNKRPIIVLGDTNCRYTRDYLKANFIDVINADPRFEIHDPWIDFPREGVYPEQGAPSIMVDSEGQQKGEVVDKIFYINNTDAPAKLTAHSYLRDDTFKNAAGEPLADHYPIVVNFTIENPEASPIAEGEQYFLRNAATGTYLAPGGWWGTHAMVAETGNRITIENAGNNQVRLKSTLGYIYNGNDIYIDAADANAANTYVMTPTSEGRYAFVTADGAYAIGADLTNQYVNNLSYSDSDAAQQWEILTEDDLLDELGKATAENPKEATFMIRGANPIANDTDVNAYWARSGVGKNAKYQIAGSGDANFNAVYRCYNDKCGTFVNGSTTSYTISQTLNNLPNGKYKLSWQVAASTNITFSANEVSETFNTGTSATLSCEEAVSLFQNGGYTREYELEVTNHSITIKIDKGSNTSATSVCFDNFRLFYLGNQSLYDRVKLAIDRAQEVADQYGYTDYDNSTVVARWQNREIDINSTGDEEIRQTVEALQRAAIESNSAPMDVTYAILNNSFEYAGFKYGGAYGWKYTDGGDTKVIDNANAVYTANPCDGEMLFNTWINSDTYGEAGFPVSQTISGLPGGKYVLRAKVASHNGNTVYIFANDNNTGYTIPDDKTVFHEVELEFELSDGEDLTIGAAGGYNGEFTMADAVGCWFKADDFRLERLETYSIITLDFPGEFDTLVLPFDSEVPEGLSVYGISGYKAKNQSHSTYGTHHVVSLYWVDHIEAHTPYVVQDDRKNSAASRAAVSDDTYTFRGRPDYNIPAEGLKNGVLIGTYTPTTVGDNDFVINDHQYMGNDRTVFTKAAAHTTNSVDAYRAYISDPEAAGIDNILFYSNDTPTGIEEVGIDADTNVDVYTVSGILLRSNTTLDEALDTLAPGIYIVRAGATAFKIAK